MNKVVLIGRLGNDPEVKYTQAAEPMTVCRFSIAVDRPYSKNRKENDKTVDFINCVSFGSRADNIGKFFSKGNRIAITGRIQTGEYTDKQNIKRYTTDVLVEDFEFVESKSTKDNSNNNYAQNSYAPRNNNANIPPVRNMDDMDLPFN